MKERGASAPFFYFIYAIDFFFSSSFGLASLFIFQFQIQSDSDLPSQSNLTEIILD